MPKKKATPLHKIIVVGVGGVGKSALTLQFMYGDFVEEYDPTSADSYRKKATIDNEEVQLDILDTAGQEEYAAMRDNYYRTGEGFLAVYSIVLEDSFTKLEDFHDQILKVTEDDDMPFVLVANKIDLEDQRKISKTDGETLARKFRTTILEASAKKNINVSEAFAELVRKIKAHKASKIKKDPPKSRCVLQ